MRVLKYIFLLVLLLFVATTVFIATSESQYTLVRKKYIKSPKNIVFAFVEDYSLWEIWFISDDKSMSFSQGTGAVGKGPGLKWTGEAGSGLIETTYIKSNDSIVQHIILNDAPAKGFWKFKDTIGGTIATWKIVGSLSFKDKFASAFQGGAANLVDRMYERSIMSLDRIVTKEVNTYKIKVEGIFDLPPTNYVYQKLTSRREDVNRNIRVMMSKLDYFIRKNQLQTGGAPYVMYEKQNPISNNVTFSVCLPLTEEIFVAPGSDIATGHHNGYRAVKATLTGDYSHLDQARSAVDAYMIKYKLNANPIENRIERYTVRSTTQKLPSKWSTEIYYPIGSKMVVANRPVTAPIATPRTQPKLPEPDTEEFDL